MVSFLYPRTIAIHRPQDQSGGGLLGYGGQVEASETPVVAGIPASIQERREGAINPAGLPGDTRVPSHYVYIPRNALANGTIRSRDIIIDDLGIRYQCVAPYWDSLGYRLTVSTLEV